MARYIDADELELEYYDLSIHGTIAVKSVLPIFAKLLDNQPTADVEEVKHAQIVRNERNIAKMKEFHEKGIGLEIGEKSIFWTCSECGNLVKPYNKRCSECGAKMDGGKAE